MKNFDTMLVGFDHSHGDPAVLIVGRKAPGDNVRMFGVKETCCTRCSHRDVCQYKSEYLAAQTAVDEVSVRRPSKDDESISSIRLHDIPWIEPVELKCTYFRQDTGTIR